MLSFLHVFELGSACKRFDQSWCDECLYKNHANSIPYYWLKCLAQLVTYVYELVDDGVAIKNTLLID